MKKKFFYALTICSLSFVVLSSSSCGSENTSQSESGIQNESGSFSNTDDSTLVSSESVSQSKASGLKKDFVGDSYSDIGDGTFCLVNQSGNTENGNPIVIYSSPDDLLIQIGYESSEMNGGVLSYIYIDGMLALKEQLGETQGQLDLSGDNLSVGMHKVEVVQYENDDTSGTVTAYKSASYEVKGK